MRRQLAESRARIPPARDARPYAQTWLRRQRQRIKPRSLEAYEGVFNRHVVPHFGEATPLETITRAGVRDFLLEKLAAGYSAATVRHMLGILRTVLNGARFDDNLIAQNPCDRLTRTLPPRAEHGAEKVLRPDQLRRLLDAFRSLHPRIYPMIVVAAACGLRVGELTAFRWDDVDLEDGVITIRRNRDARGRMGTPKGRKAARLPLTAPAVAALRELRALPPLSSDDWVFPSPYGGKPWSRTYIRRTLHRACKLAGIPPVSMHVLRHSFITAAAATGADAWVVQQLARHANLTTQAYIHLARVRPEHAVAMNAVASHLFGTNQL